MDLKELRDVRVDNAVREIERGEIYMVNLDRVEQNFVGSEQKGSRPAIIISNNIGNKVSPICEVVYITTAFKPKMPTHVYISAPGVCGTALCESINTLSKQRLDKRICLLSEQQMQLIDKALCVSIEITKKPTSTNDQTVAATVSTAEKVISQVDGSDENYLIKQLNDHVKTVLELGNELNRTDNELNKIMQSDVVLTGIEGDYLNDEIKNEIRHKAAEGVHQKKSQLENSIEKLIGIVHDKVPVIPPEINEVVVAPKEPKAEKKTAYTIEEVKRLTNEGWTQQRIADKFGVTVSAINKFMKSHDITKRKPTIPEGREKMSKDEFKRRMLRDRK